MKDGKGEIRFHGKQWELFIELPKRLVPKLLRNNPPYKDSASWVFYDSVAAKFSGDSFFEEHKFYAYAFRVMAKKLNEWARIIEKMENE